MLPEAMADPRHDAALAYLRRSQQTLERACADGAFVDAIVAIAGRIAACLKNGGKVLLAGNGGSASDAQHIAAELVGRFTNDRAPLAAIALTTDTSALTAISNDYGFEHVFERQVRALGRSGDVFIGLSTSGRSPNIVAALKAARELGLTTVGFTRDAQTPMHALCDLVLAVPSDETALIQQIHITAAHAICHLVEHELFGAGRA
jgi:D-sedoheptulose 7-phosphate isomerase